MTLFFCLFLSGAASYVSYSFIALMHDSKAIICGQWRLKLTVHPMNCFIAIGVPVRLTLSYVEKHDPLCHMLELGRLLTA